MTIEELWQELEAEAAAGSNAAWLTRFARPQPGPTLLVALEQTKGSRALLLPVSKSLLPLRRDWPECRGLEMFTIALNGSPHLGVRLRDKNSADVFTALAEDVSPRVSAAVGMREALAALLNRLSCWQQFLAAMKDGLSLEAQRGLFGELHVLKTHLIPTFGNDDAVESWKAPSAAHQDFQFSSGAIEVKTTAAKQPQAVRITSERQLDEAGVGALFLHVVAVDEREVTSVENLSPGRRRGDETQMFSGSEMEIQSEVRVSSRRLLQVEQTGTTLPDLIAILRSVLATDTSALHRFNDRVLDAGYLDIHAVRYEVRRYAVRREWTFRVTGKFPRLVEKHLPEGIGEVNYALSLAACAPFAVEIINFVSEINAPCRKPQQQRKTKCPKP